MVRFWFYAAVSLCALSFLLAWWYDSSWRRGMSLSLTPNGEVCTSDAPVAPLDRTVHAWNFWHYVHDLFVSRSLVCRLGAAFSAHSAVLGGTSSVGVQE